MSVDEGLVDAETTHALRESLAETIKILGMELRARKDLHKFSATSSMGLADIIDSLVETYVKLGGPLSALPPFSDIEIAGDLLSDAALIALLVDRGLIGIIDR